MITYLLALGIGVGLQLLRQYLRIRHYWQISQHLVDRAEPPDQHPDDPDLRVLIIGNSLWAGVGAEDPVDSMAGRLIADLPNALVVNKAESGARIADGHAQLAEAISEYGDNFDQIIIQLGANDIVHLSNLRQAKCDLKALLRRARGAGDYLAYAVSGSVGFAPLFLQPFDWFYGWVSRRYIFQFRKVAGNTGAAYIDLYYQRSEDPFSKDPDKYYADDLFHPSAAGYKLWYRKCRNQLQCFELEQ